MAYYYLNIIRDTVLFHIASLGRVRWRFCHAGSLEARPSLLDRALVAWQMLTYRQLCGRRSDRLSLPSCGIITLLGGTFVLAVISKFAAQPHHREHRGYGSPPIAART